MDLALVEILRCPRSRQRLRPMRDAELAAAAERTGRGWAAGLVTLDGAYAYPVERCIYGLLPGLAVARGEVAAEAHGAKADVQRFYDEVGWQQGDDGEFADATLFEDLRGVARDYIHACHERVGRHLVRPGGYLLDVASGPVQYEEYLRYAEGYAARLCVDVSRVALAAAQRRLGDRGRYVLGDITCLPLADGSVDGAVSLHTIYHVPAAEQERAFLELHRVLAPGRAAVVVYSWGGARLTQALMLPAWPLRRALQAWRRARGEAPPLYFHPHPHAWFASRPWPFEVRVLPWRSLGLLPMRAYVHRALGGALLLRALFALEERFPDALGRIGEYPLIVVRKAA